MRGYSPSLLYKRRRDSLQNHHVITHYTATCTQIFFNLTKLKTNSSSTSSYSLIMINLLFSFMPFKLLENKLILPLGNSHYVSRSNINLDNLCDRRRSRTYHEQKCRLFWFSLWPCLLMISPECP